jgi:hypothetical protein
MKNNCTELVAIRHGETEWNRLGRQQGHLDSLFRYVLEIPLNQKRNFSLLNSSLNTFIIEDTIWKLKSWGEISPLKGMMALDDF